MVANANHVRAKIVHMMNIHNYRKERLVCSLVLLTSLLFVFTGHGSSAPVELRCEYLVNPQGIDATQPRLFWQWEAARSAVRGHRQTAYQVLVATNETDLRGDKGDLWDSGKVMSDESAQIPYSGKPLTSQEACWWKVRVWDENGGASAWSRPAHWTTGLLQPDDWKGQWIGFDEPTGGQPRNLPGAVTDESETRRLAARWLRKEFPVSRAVRRATVYFSGLGLSELYLNGQKVGEDALSPGLTDYDKRVFYVTHDVTGLVRAGRNAVGVVLGNGRFYAPRVRIPTRTRSFGFPKLLLQLEVEYTDGTRDVIVSDSSWKLTTAGPIQANNEYDGEEYDARREMPGWAKAGFDDSAWSSAQIVSAPGGQLAAQMIEPIRVTGILKPVALAEPSPGVFIFDLGQNMVGWCRLKMSGPAGTKVMLRHAETLKPDGTLYLDNIRGAKVTDSYTLNGKGLEVYEPRFTYHGFRYVEVTGFPGKPALAALEGRVVNDDLEGAGEFSCSQPMINRIYRNVLWGVRGNYRSIVTDCPQRDERQGWLGDRSAESRGEAYLFDIAALYAKWTQDMADSQRPSGSICDVCPSYWPMYNDNVTWPSSAVIIPGALLDQYADTGVVARMYPSMVKWVDHMSGFIKEGIIAKDNYGDWCVPPKDARQIHSTDPALKTAPEILATTYFYHCLKLMTHYATVLDKNVDAQRFNQLAEQLKTALNEKFYNPQAGYYGNGSQTACVLPLAFDMVPEAGRGRVFEHLAEKITQESKGHIGTGLVGGQWLNRVLTEGGRVDLAYGFATNTTYPSWGYMVEKGATTVWELWNGDTADPAMNSGNHVMLVGDFVIWLYEDLAGIQSDPAQPGFKHILLRPQPVGDLKWVKTSLRSLHGIIRSDWKIEGGNFQWKVTVPPNATATVYVPTRDPALVTEGGRKAATAAGVKFLRRTEAEAVYEIESGSYEFRSPVKSAEH
jgi:alpha-L-rhamnosidase